MGRWLSSGVVDLRLFSGIRKDLSDGGCSQSRNMVVPKVRIWLFSKWEDGWSQSRKVVVPKVGRWLFSKWDDGCSQSGWKVVVPKVLRWLFPK